MKLTLSMYVSKTSVGHSFLMRFLQIGHTDLFFFHWFMQNLQKVWEQLSVMALINNSVHMLHCNSFSQVANLFCWLIPSTSIAVSVVDGKLSAIFNGPFSHFGTDLLNLTSCCTGNISSTMTIHDPHAIVLTCDFRNLETKIFPMIKHVDSLRYGIKKIMDVKLQWTQWNCLTHLVIRWTIFNKIFFANYRITLNWFRCYMSNRRPLRIFWSDRVRLVVKCVQWHTNFWTVRRVRSLSENTIRSRTGKVKPQDKAGVLGKKVSYVRLQFSFIFTAKIVKILVIRSINYISNQKNLIS